MNKQASTGGTQSMRRALALLRVLAQHQEDGIDLQGVMARTGLERSTAHRLLAMLQYRGFVRQDAASRSYVPGPSLDDVGALYAKALASWHH